MDRIVAERMVSPTRPLTSGEPGKTSFFHIHTGIQCVYERSRKNWEIE